MYGYIIKIFSSSYSVIEFVGRKQFFFKRDFRDVVVKGSFP